MEKSFLKGDTATVMSHFYRGELGRMMMWRDRLDRTTNWAILGITGLITFSWNQSEHSHFFLFFSNAILYLLLTIEARRYRFYDAYRGRVRVLESHFILPYVVQNPAPLEGNWRSLLATDLAVPSFKISFWEAISRRLRRNYLWLFLIVLCAWFGHISYHSHKLEATWRQMFTEHQPLPLWMFFGVIVFFYLYLAFLYLVSFRTRKASGEFQKRPPTDKRKWSI